MFFLLWSRSTRLEAFQAGKPANEPTNQPKPNHPANHQAQPPSQSIANKKTVNSKPIGFYSREGVYRYSCAPLKATTAS